MNPGQHKVEIVRHDGSQCVNLDNDGQDEWTEEGDGNVPPQRDGNVDEGDERTDGLDA